MQLTTLGAVASIAATLALLGGAGQAMAQAYPSKPIRLVVGFAPGGAADYVARAIGDPLGRALGQSVIVDNKAGAGSSLAADFVAKAPADGYTLLIASPSSISVNPSLNPKLGYTAKDLLPISKITSSPLIIAVNPAAGLSSVQDLVASAKKRPGSINYTTSGNGSAPHLGAVHFSRVAGVEMTHIPYRGGAPAVQAVIAGDAQLTFGTPPSVLPMVQAGRLRAIGVTSVNRSPLVPDLPGMAESGLPNYSISFWYGIFAPAGTPPEVVRKVFDAAQEVLKRPEAKATLAREGTEVALSKSPEEFSAFLIEDNRFWARLAKESGAKLD